MKHVCQLSKNGFGFQSFSYKSVPLHKFYNQFIFEPSNLSMSFFAKRSSEYISIKHDIHVFNMVKRGKNGTCGHIGKVFHRLTDCMKNIAYLLTNAD